MPSDPARHPEERRRARLEGRKIRIAARCGMNTFTTSDGLSLTYYVDDFTNPWAKAPTVLLLHAAMGSALRYFGWVPHLCRAYRVVRLDLRGHGASQVP